MKYFSIDPSKISYRKKILHNSLSIYELFKRAYQTFDSVVYLESLGEYSNFSRYSILLFDPYAHVEAFDNSLRIDDREFMVENPFDELRELKEIKVDSYEYCGGLFGYISYEGTKYLDAVSGFRQNEAFADFEFGLFLDGVLYDKQTGELSYFYLLEDRSQLVEKLSKQTLQLETFSYEDLGPNTSQDEYVAMINQCKEHINAGDIFQVIMSVQFQYRLKGCNMLVYDRLREINPSPYLSYIKFGKREIITSSVDLVTRVRRDPTGLIGRRIENFALAGTTVRGNTPEEDDRLFQELVKNEKERAEHMMLVDLGRNDIGRVCKFGSVRVTQLMIPKRFSHVQHIESQIEGEVMEGADMFDCVKATAPMGTVTGAPKIEAMKIINKLEKAPRGPYAGELGGFGFNGDCIFSVGLRSLFISGEQAYAQVGSGVVYDSTADYEYREILRKGKGMLAAMKLAAAAS